MSESFHAQTFPINSMALMLLTMLMTVGNVFAWNSIQEHTNCCANKTLTCMCMHDGEVFWNFFFKDSVPFEAISIIQQPTQHL